MTLLRWAFADAYADQVKAERIVSASDLDWTIARLNRLTDDSARGNVRFSTDLLSKPRSLTRADVATTLLDLAETTTYIKTAVNLGGT